jgi:putative ABC transport system permease protein
MLKNYLKTAWRNLLRNKISSFINITGLAVGMAVAILIGLWLWNEISFNKSFENYKTIAQVFQNQNFSGEINTQAAVPMPLANELRTKYGSNFRRVVLASYIWNHIISYGNKNLLEPGNFMEPEGAELFSLHMLQGKRSALANSSAILLSESVAKAVFGNDDPMGKILKLDNKMNVKVGGVYADFPITASMNDLSFTLPWDLYYTADESLKDARTNWGYNSFQIYVQVADNAKMDVVSAKIKNAKLNHSDKEDAKFQTAIFLQPMSNWRLYSEFKNGVNVGGRIQYAWMYGIIGMFVLLLACINFMNLSTARSEKRAKEVGIRKAIGSLRSQLISQFFTESLLVTIFAFCLSIFLVQLSLPFFNSITERKITTPWNSIYFWLTGIGFSIITGLIAGSYPALYLSSFRPVKVLKGTFRAGSMATVPRKVLVVLQFSVSVILIISTIVVSRQVQFARNRPVGYSRDGLIAMEMFSPNIHYHFSAFKNDLINTGAVTEAAESGSTTTGVYNNNGDFHWNGKDPNMADMFATIGISNSYGKTVGWQFISGRDFSAEFATDSSGLVLNEASVKYMHLTNPVGETIKWGRKDYKVIGVIKDMVMESPYEPSRQTVFYIDKGDGDFLNIRLNPSSSTADALSKIATVFKKYEPSVPFDYKFADTEYAKKFAIEERVGRLASFFASLAIFISCLGLFGMASFMAEQRVKEIGVRKVLGASVFNLWKLLSKDFVALVIISLLIAMPVAYYFMNKWLQNYQYHTTLSWWVFGAAGAGALLITLLTVSFQSIKAALANPVKSLRTE